ncbi:MAG TPA: glycosyltransferase family 4 protein [Candidatus Krumholzibacteria bacterium]|nr:glycosyltransferase family 4 protein [Candidatus Krumholzibacteria bacterium]
MTRRTGMRPLRIAMVGQKGIPARYGGVETHVENVAVRLAARGHDVTVFCRRRLRANGDAQETPSRNGTYRGVHLLYRASVNTKHFDAATHAFLSTLESSCRHHFDVVHLHGIGPAAFAPVAGLFGRKVVSTFHALDWRQVKWGPRAKSLLRRGEAIGARASDGVIAVSRLMQVHIQSTHGVDAAYIPNGATLPAKPVSAGSLSQWGLVPGEYLLTVGRVIADRDLETLLRAFASIRDRHPRLRLVIVGSETPRTVYSELLERMAGERVVFTGDVFGEALQALYAHCLVYVLASRVEGLPITVCEAMAHGRALVLSDIPENAEVGGDTARFFKCGDDSALANQLHPLIEDRAARDALGAVARARCEAHYNWEHIADQVESLYYRVLSHA